MRIMLGAVAAMVLSACNPGSGSDAGTTDAGGSDAGTPVTRHFVFESITFPTNNSAAREAAVDLNGDGALDNQMGMVFGTLNTQGLEANPDMQKAIDTGAAIQLLSVVSLDGNAAVTIRAVPGLDPMPAACSGSTDTVCRHHLDGLASFTASSTMVAALTGGVMADGGVLTSATAPLTLQVSFFGGPASLALQHPHVSINPAADAGLTEGVVAGAILESDVNAVVVPAIAAGMQAHVTADCSDLANPPACGCMAGSLGRSLLDLADASPRDCQITAADVAANSLFSSLLASDLMLDGRPALSFGTKFTAVPATFTLSGE